MIVATAGHVDHGKTLLIKALTGTDTDRLPEEKARGLSIDLGFAYTPLPNGDILGFVDVPGHEKFIRNMLCGVAAVDFALLVVAADDGPMPQTEEHLAIVDQLGIRQGAVALTKTDRADANRIRQVREDIAALLEATGLAGVPVFEASGLTGDGVPALRGHLEEAAGHIAARSAGGNFRLAIDRDFTVPGAGLVVTGSVFSGAAAVEDRLMLSPQGVEVRVRGIHAQNRASETARAGQRCALNIAGPGLRNVDIHRGDWLVAEPIHAPVRRFDARVTVLPGEAGPLAHWTPVHLHLAASDVTARMAVLAAKEIAPGTSHLVQLVLDSPVGAVRGDRFILRDQSARRTVAGGHVVDIFPPVRGRARPERLDYLAAMEAATPREALASLLETMPGGIDPAPFATAWNLTPAEAEAIHKQVPMVTLGTPGAERAMSPGRWTDLREQALGAITAWHERNPEAVGPDEPTLRRALPSAVPARLFRAVSGRLIRDGDIVREGLSLRLPSHRPRLSNTEEELWERIRPTLEAGELRPPRIREVAETLNLDLPVVEDFFARAARMGLLLPVAPNRFYLPGQLLDLAKIAEALAATAPEAGFDAKTFRDESGIGRNLTIEVLEFFDKCGFTRRYGDNRRIVRPAADTFSAT